MTHESFQERLLDLAYGELTPRQAREVEEHAASCERCGAELSRIRETRRVMAALPQEPAPERGERILVAAAREAVRQREVRRAPPRWLWSGAIAAASLAVVGTVSYRILADRPAMKGSEDRRALMSDSGYARAPEPAPEAPAAAAPEPPRSPERAEPAPTPAPARKAPPPRGAPAGRVADLPRLSTPQPDRKAEAEAQRFATPPQPPAPLEAAPPSAAPREAPPAAGPHEAAPAQRRAAPAPQASAPAQRSEEAAPTAGAAPRPPGRAAFAVSPEGAAREADEFRIDERTFPGCDREPWRRVERDGRGRVRSYAWEERVAGRRVRFEAVYAPDGALVAKRAIDVETAAPVPGLDFEAPDPSRVDVDAPSRCAR